MFEDIGSDNQIKRFIFECLRHEIFTAKPLVDLASRRVWKEMSRKILRDILASVWRITDRRGTIHGSSIPAILDKVQQLRTSMPANVECSGS